MQLTRVPKTKSTLLSVSYGSGKAFNENPPHYDTCKASRTNTLEALSYRWGRSLEAATRDREGIYVGSLRGDSPVCIASELSTTRFVRSAGSKSKGFILFRRATTLMAQPFDAAKLLFCTPLRNPKTAYCRLLK